MKVDDLASGSRTRAGNPGSTQGQPRVKLNPGSTQGQTEPRVNPGSTQGQPRVTSGSTQCQPGVNLHRPTMSSCFSVGAGRLGSTSGIFGLSVLVTSALLSLLGPRPTWFAPFANTPSNRGKRGAVFFSSLAFFRSSFAFFAATSSSWGLQISAQHVIKRVWFPRLWSETTTYDVESTIQSPYLRRRRLLHRIVRSVRPFEEVEA
jgi:hypothetical protein